MMEEVSFRLCHFLKIKIIGYENKTPDFFLCRAFTQYHIKTKESFSRKSILVKKRYSEFLAFSQKMSLFQIKLPKFPKKQFKGRLEEEFIKSRVKKFQDLLSYLLRLDLNKLMFSYNQEAQFKVIDLISDFLYIPQETSKYIKQVYTSPLNKEINQNSDDNFVYNFLNKIHYEPESKQDILQDASNLFFSRKIVLRAKMIEMLLRGINLQQFKMKGLIQLCGDTGSRSISHDALVFILKLIDSEVTRESYQFLKILVTTEIPILREMGLEKHILSFKQTKTHALQIMKCLYNHYTIVYPCEYEEKLLEVVQHQQVLEIFEKELTSIKAFCGDYEYDTPIFITNQGAQGKEFFSDNFTGVTEGKSACLQEQK